MSDPAVPVLELFGLIRRFIAKNSQKDAMTLAEFTDFLNQSGFKDMADGIGRSQQLQLDIGQLLERRTSSILNIANKIDEKFAALLSHLGGAPGQIARTANPSAMLSDQALDLLRAMDRQDVDTLIVARHMNGTSVGVKHPEKASGGKWEDKYLIDDIHSLVDVGLLRKDSNSSGHPIYRWTRAAKIAITDD